MLEASRVTTYRIEMDEDTLIRLERSLGRVLEAVNKMPQERREWLTSLHSTKDLISLRQKLAEIAPA